MSELTKCLIFKLFVTVIFEGYWGTWTGARSCPGSERVNAFIVQKGNTLRLPFLECRCRSYDIN